MYLYRVIEKESFLEGKLTNKKRDEERINTFNYNGEEYVHFFVLPECAEIYQKLAYTNNGLESFITKWNIPYSLIKEGFGVGLYRYYSPKHRDPFLEVYISKNKLKRSMLEECSKEMYDGWKNNAIYNRYLECLGLELSSKKMEHPLYFDCNESFIDQLELHPRLNPKFNFLNYFPVEDLVKEGLSNDYDAKDDIVEEKPTLKSRIVSIFSKKR